MTDKELKILAEYFELLAEIDSKLPKDDVE